MQITVDDLCGGKEEDDSSDDLEMLDYVSAEDSDDSYDTDDAEQDEDQDDDEEDWDGTEGDMDDVEEYMDGIEEEDADDMEDDDDDDDEEEEEVEEEEWEEEDDEEKDTEEEDIDDTMEEYTDDDMQDATLPPPPPPANTPVKASCIACLDDETSPDDGGALVTVPCGDKYCAACLRRYFAASSLDTSGTGTGTGSGSGAAASMFPPRCCGREITLDNVIRPLLGPKLIRAYEVKARAVRDRGWHGMISCAFADCGQTIHVGDVDGSLQQQQQQQKPQQKKKQKKPLLNTFSAPVVNCAYCRRTTCRACFGPGHPGVARCPPDASRDAALALVRAEKWPQCSRCGMMVQRTGGCNHMS